MSFLNPDHMTLSQALELQQYDSAAKFMASLEKKSTLTQLIPWYPTSHGLLHKGVKATSLPEGDFVSFNQGTPGGNASTESYEVSVKSFELSNTIDKRFFRNMDATGAAKMREARDRMFALGFMQSFSKHVINNDGTRPDACKGLLARRDVLDNILTIDMGGTATDSGTMTSMLLIKPGDDGICFRYPSAAGVPNFSQEDVGEIQIINTDPNTGKFISSYTALKTVWQLSYLIDIFDENSLIRLVNIPSQTAMSSSMVNKFIDVFANLKEPERYFGLASPQCIAQFQKYCLDKNNINFTYESVQGLGSPVSILGTKVFRDDYLVNNETRFTSPAA